MKCNIVRTVSFATLLLSLAAVASAQGHRHCSNASLAGTWGYTETGTVILSPAPPAPGPVLAAAVGTYTFDAHGNFSGTQYSTSGGSVGADTKEGTYTVSPDCTGILTLDAYRAGILQRHSVWAIVLVDNAKEIRAMMLSMAILTLPPTISVGPVMTMTARRLFPDRDDEHER